MSVPAGRPTVAIRPGRAECRRAAPVTVGLSWMSRPSRGTGPGHRTVAPGATHGLDCGATCTTLAPDHWDVTTGLASATCVQDACKRFSTKRRLADHPTRGDGADQREHHQLQSDNTGHHGSGSPLNLRVRGSSPWRRTMSDLALYTFPTTCRSFMKAQCVQMRAESERGSHASKRRPEICWCQEAVPKATWIHVARHRCWGPPLENQRTTGPHRSTDSRREVNCN